MRPVGAVLVPGGAGWPVFPAQARLLLRLRPVTSARPWEKLTQTARAGRPCGEISRNWEPRLAGRGAPEPAPPLSQSEEGRRRVKAAAGATVPRMFLHAAAGADDNVINSKVLRRAGSRRRQPRPGWVAEDQRPPAWPSCRRQCHYESASLGDWVCALSPSGAAGSESRSRRLRHRTNSAAPPSTHTCTCSACPAGGGRPAAAARGAPPRPGALPPLYVPGTATVAPPRRAAAGPTSR